MTNPTNTSISHQQEIALKFAKDCLKWDASKIPGRQALGRKVYEGDGSFRQENLWYAVLTSVFSKAVDWCRFNRVHWGIYEYRISPITPVRYEFEARFRHEDWLNNCHVRHENVNMALMLGCLKVSDYLKTDTQP